MAIERRKDKRNKVLKEGEYQRASGTYEFKWRDRSGERHSISAATLEELRAKELDAFRDILDGVRTDKNNLTVNDLYYRWVQIKRGLKNSTFANYKCVYSRYVEPEFGKNKLAGLKRTDVRKFYNYLADKKHLKVGSIYCVHAVLHQVLELGVEDDYLRYNPSDGAMKELKNEHCFETKKKRALTIAEQEIFENYLSKNSQYHKWYPIFEVMLWTGMRVGEVTGLRWCDISIEDEIINVNHTLVCCNVENGRNKTFAINTPKTKKGERIIPMLPKVKEAFLMEKAYQEESGRKRDVAVDGYRDFIFINGYGNLYHLGVLDKALERIVKACNREILNKHEKDAVLLPKFSNHTLRHTFTTRMCEAGVNIKAMQEILGHADATITMNIYAEATEDLKRSELIKFDNYFKQKAV